VSTDDKQKHSKEKEKKGKKNITVSIPCPTLAMVTPIHHNLSVLLADTQQKSSNLPMVLSSHLHTIHHPFSFHSLYI
jgi:hypothetical protein